MKADIFSTMAIYQEEPGLLVILKPIYNKDISLSEQREDRLSKAVFTLADSYNDIDLSNGSYRYLFYEDPSNIQYKVGDDYDKIDYFSKASLLLVEQKDAKKIAKLCSFSHLKALSKIGDDVSFVFKIKDKPIWKELRIRFIKQCQSHPHACVFILDATSDHMKNFDSLTNLLNRNEGQTKIDEYLVTHFNKKAAFGIVDLDYFKSFNDKFGHPTGDRILVETGKLLNSLGPNFIFQTRLGGDEFCLLITKQINAKQIVCLRKKLSSGFKQIGLKLNLDITLDASLGIANYPLEGLSFDDLYHRADEDLYNVKKSDKR